MRGWMVRNRDLGYVVVGGGGRLRGICMGRGTGRGERAGEVGGWGEREAGVVLVVEAREGVGQCKGGW